MSTGNVTRVERSEVNGLLLLNKPAGLTSNQALQRVKRLFNARKAGHTGSLDPAATGMLPLCFGEATKVCAYLLEADKTYRVTARLGVATDTGDA
ncbi:MAG: tRNA pseudouridine(55) synthase TruB, partial [Woeseiaceae bacterium]